MLVRFSVENWMSFRDRVEFNMIATKERQHNERLAELARYRMKLLPVAAVYGGNASGKTNLFRAMGFARQLIVEGTQPDRPLAVEPFRLDSECSGRPSSFCFEILVNDVCFEFAFSLDRKGIRSERLVQLTRAGERTLYVRTGDQIDFDQSLKEHEFLEFVHRGTRDNQLFLTNSVSQKVDLFKPIHDWFRNTLVLIAPDARYQAVEEYLSESSPLSSAVGEILPQLDTGISRLGEEAVPLGALPFDEAEMSDLSGLMTDDNETVNLTLPGERLILSKRQGALVARRLVTFHAGVGGKEVKFAISRESDGTQRILDLLPAFVDLSTQGSRRVYVIDEIDRSLHALMTRQLLEMYLSGCTPGSRVQLLFTTHDALLMDQDLLRRDEMWVTERDRAGASSLFSFSEFKDVRYDKDIRKSYLQGRLGGVPRILLDGTALSAHVAARTKAPE